MRVAQYMKINYTHHSNCSGCPFHRMHLTWTQHSRKLRTHGNYFYVTFDQSSALPSTFTNDFQFARDMTTLGQELASTPARINVTVIAREIIMYRVKLSRILTVRARNGFARRRFRSRAVNGAHEKQHRGYVPVTISLAATF